MLWLIELKFCISLCFTVLQIKFECRQFASIFVGVMPSDQVRVLSTSVKFCRSYAPFGLRILENTVFHTFLLHALTYQAEILHMTLFYCTTDQVRVLSISVIFFMELYPFRNVEYLKIHSFPHFSLTCFDILSWNFAYDFVLLYYRLSLSFLNLRWFLWALCPFWKSEYWKYTVFCTFLLRALTYWAETLHTGMTLFSVQKIKFECHNSVSVWLSVRPSIFCIFLLHTSTYLAEN